MSKYAFHFHSLNLPLKLKNVELYKCIFLLYELGEFLVIIFTLKDYRIIFTLEYHMPLLATTSHQSLRIQRICCHVDRKFFSENQISMNIPYTN